MISEKTLSTSFSTFWSDALPFLSPTTITELNLLGERWKRLDGKWTKPLADIGGETENDLTAEIAFELFYNSIIDRKRVLEIAADQSLVEIITTNSTNRLIRLKGYSSPKRLKIESSQVEAVELAHRIEDFFNQVDRSKPVIVQPKFKGCGLLDSCYGDVITPYALYEIKMVDRNLRSADLKQALIYSALGNSSGEYSIDKVCILNPRRGLSYEFNISDIVNRLSGRSTLQFYNKLTDFLSNREIPL